MYVSVEHVASAFRVEDQGMQEISMKLAASKGTQRYVPKD
jgi:hypothetical protein